MFGSGSKFFGALTPILSGGVTGANDGLSLAGTIAQLGQTVGAVGNPAKLLQPREIPFNSFSLLLSGLGEAAGEELIMQYGLINTLEPFIIFKSTAGTVIGAIRFGDQANGQIYIGPNAGPNATGQGGIFIGRSAGSTFTAEVRNILIGDGAGQGMTGTQFGIIIGTDSGDPGPSTTGQQPIIIGHDSFNNGFGFGDDLISIGSLINNSNGGNVGANVIVISPGGAGGSSLSGGITNACVILPTANGTGNYSLSNTFLLGDNTHNILIGQTALAYHNGADRVQVQGSLSSQGIKQAVRAGILADTFASTDYLINMDTTAGNATVSITPANLYDSTYKTGNIGNIKKISADANTITLNATAGLIYGLGAPAASISFNSQGQNLTFQSDGTNIYIL